MLNNIQTIVGITDYCNEVYEYFNGVPETLT